MKKLGILAPVYDAWMAFSHVLGMIMSKIILTVLWLTVFAAYAVVLKVVAVFTSKTKSDSYWVDTPPPTDFRHQF